MLLSTLIRLRMPETVNVVVPTGLPVNLPAYWQVPPKMFLIRRLNVMLRVLVARSLTKLEAIPG
jgi:hypothetical protein